MWCMTKGVASVLALAIWMALSLPSILRSEESPDYQIRYAKAVKAKLRQLGFTGGYDIAPKPEDATCPDYPEQAVAECRQGTVVVVFGVERNGRVAMPEVVESVPGLDKAALTCVKKWRFKPAKKGGKAVGSAFAIPIEFRLQGSGLECAAGVESSTK